MITIEDKQTALAVALLLQDRHLFKGCNIPEGEMALYTQLLVIENLSPVVRVLVWEAFALIEDSTLEGLNTRQVDDRLAAWASAPAAPITETQAMHVALKLINDIPAWKQDQTPGRGFSSEELQRREVQILKLPDSVQMPVKKAFALIDYYVEASSIDIRQYCEQLIDERLSRSNGSRGAKFEAG